MDERLVLPVLVADRARTHPGKVFVEEVGGERLTYAQYDLAIRRWAAAFRRVGVVEGDRVVTMLPASVPASCAWLGLGWLRAIEVPCNNEYRGRMLGYLVADSGARTILIDGRFLDRLAEVAGDLPDLERVVVFGAVPGGLELPWTVVPVADFLAGAEPAAIDELPTPLPSDLCALLYTSGTTGNSKGVRFPWGQLYTQGIGFIPLEDLTEDDAWYMPYPINHVSGKTPFYTMILANGRIVIRNGFDSAAFWDDIDTYGCTSTAMLGPMAPYLYQAPPAEGDAGHVLQNVFMVPIPPFIDEFKERFGVRVCTSYGSVENSVPIKVPGWGVSGANWRSCGKLRQGWPGYEVRLVDEHDREVPVGEVGELIMRASEPWVMNLGYFGMPEKTVEAWRNGWFHSGDALRCDEDGNYYFVDRVRDCIRRRGENISSFEVEAEVNAHPAVAESAAVGVPAAVGEEEIKVSVVVEPGQTFDPADLIHFLIPRVPRFMVPRYVEVVDSFPKTEATLRVRKHLLREHALGDATWDREAAGIEVPR
jgi:crotonobetaine/carnitine-CoA ligase